MKHTALYLRVSTEAQADEGYSLAAQAEKLEAYCRMKGIGRFTQYVDGGFSGSNLSRPAVTQLIDCIRRGEVERVVVYKLDRLSRSQKDTLYLIEDVFAPHDVDFVSINENIDTGTPYGRAMIGILSAFAQLERENIFLRTRMGMVERVRQGYWPGGGKVPFGYDYDAAKGILVPNRDADTVREIYARYLAGESGRSVCATSISCGRSSTVRATPALSCTRASAIPAAMSRSSIARHGCARSAVCTAPTGRVPPTAESC